MPMQIGMAFVVCSCHVQDKKAPSGPSGWRFYQLPVLMEHRS
jgi:hypothetical protein